MKYILLLIPSLVMAAGDSHGAGSPADLISSFVNIFILAGLLAWLAGPKIVAYFNDQSNEVEKVMRRAETKAKEANQMMAITSKKMSDSDSEIETLKANAKKQVQEFENDYNKEVAEKINRLHKDAEQKIEAEKKNLSNSVNELLVSKVVNQSKEQIARDRQLSSSSTQNLLKGL